MNQPTAPLRNFRLLVDGETYQLGDVVQKPEGLEYVTTAAALGMAYDSVKHFPCYRRIEEKSNEH